MIGRITVTVSGERDVLRMLGKAEGKELKSRIRKGTRAGASMLVSPIRKETPVRTGEMARSVKVKSLRSGGYSVGPRAWYRHFVIRGTKRGIEANPVVDRAVDPQKPAVIRKVGDVILRGK